MLGKSPAEYWQELNGDAPALSAENISNQTSASGNGDNKRPCQCHEDGQDQYCYPTDWTLKDVEKAHIMQVVDSHEGNKSAAARQLGVARKTLERKYKEWAEESASCE